MVCLNSPHWDRLHRERGIFIYFFIRQELIPIRGAASINLRRAMEMPVKVHAAHVHFMLERAGACARDERVY